MEVDEFTDLKNLKTNSESDQSVDHLQGDQLTTGGHCGHPSRIFPNCFLATPKHWYDDRGNDGVGPCASLPLLRTWEGRLCRSGLIGWPTRDDR